MRRGELLKLPELKVTETMRKTVGEDQGHQVLRCGRAPVWSATYYWFYRAKKTGTVLEIDVFTRDMILNDTRYPKYRVFLLGENKYYTYDNLCEKWRTAKIDNLSYWEGWGEIEEGYWYSSGKVWIREGDRKRITEFCHNGKEEPRAAIARWQSYSKDRKEIDEIDSEMAMVPELPKDFDEFVDREVLPQYLFYDAGRKVTKGYCTHCGREVKIRNPHYGDVGECPFCRHPITYRSRKKGGNVHARGYAGLLQKTKEGYVYRYFECHRKFRNGQKGDGGYWELIRITYDRNLKKIHEFEYEQYKQTDWVRWCYRDGWRYYAKVVEHEAILYNRNLKQILKGTPFQYSAMERFVKHGKYREKMYLDQYLNEYRYMPGIEQLVKCGFYRIVKEKMQGYNTGNLKKKERSCKKILGLNGEYYQLLAGKNPSTREYNTTYKMQEKGLHPTWQQVQFFARFPRNFTRYIRYTTIHKMERYIKEVLGEDERQAVDYHDYLKMAEKLGYNMREPWILFPKNLEQRHEELIEESREREIKAKEDLDNKKDKKYEKYRKRDSYLEMETEQFVLRLPKRIHEIRQEGNAMHHCVATYIDRVAKGETTILFLRKKQDPETPFYTMEVNNGVMIQCRAKYNGDMTEEVKEFVELFKRKKLKRTERKAG